ncbi:hypothetical protein JW935_15420 [candidate division KSB1 bacterium]|nr:hypothetical protein [candidate division KSB1 bacterium]
MTSLAHAFISSTISSSEQSEEEMFKLKKISKIISKPENVIIETTPGLNENGQNIFTLKSSSSKNQLTTVNNNIIAEKNGVIDRIDNDSVRVKLQPDIYANFPLGLFSDSKLLRLGQHIKYVIKTDSEGYRYQEIIADTTKREHPNKKAILQLLDDIKYQDE